MHFAYTDCLQSAKKKKKKQEWPDIDQYLLEVKGKEKGKTDLVSAFNCHVTSLHRSIRMVLRNLRQEWQDMGWQYQQKELEPKNIQEIRGLHRGDVGSGVFTTMGGKN